MTLDYIINNHIMDNRKVLIINIEIINNNLIKITHLLIIINQDIMLHLNKLNTINRKINNLANIRSFISLQIKWHHHSKLRLNLSH